MNRNIFVWVTSRARNWLTCAVVVLLLQGARAGEAKVVSVVPVSSEVREVASAWSNVVMIGASASAGFTVSEPFGGPTTARYRLSRYVDAALVTPHKPVTNVASSLFFLQPDAIARKQINDAVRMQPSLVLGLDFLFWFCYGEIRTNENRLERFEKGLKLVDELKCSVVLGDIPDASAAVNVILAPSQVPSAEVMAACNRRLKVWATGRKQVVLVSLSDFMRATMANEALTLHGTTFPKGKTRAFLQDDRLHPSSLGCSMLALAMIDALQSSDPKLFSAEVRWDVAEVLRVGLNNPATTNSPARGGATPVKASSEARKN